MRYVIQAEPARLLGVVAQTMSIGEAVHGSGMVEAAFEDEAEYSAVCQAFELRGWLFVAMGLVRWPRAAINAVRHA